MGVWAGALMGACMRRCFCVCRHVYIHMHVHVCVHMHGYIYACVTFDDRTHAQCKRRVTTVPAYVHRRKAAQACSECGYICAIAVGRVDLVRSTSDTASVSRDSAAPLLHCVVCVVLAWDCVVCVVLASICPFKPCM